MLIGYSCVFSWDNPTILNVQHTALLAHGVHKEKIITDNLRGRLSTRPQLELCLNTTLKAHDTLVVWRLDRMGNFRQQYNILKKLKEKNINFQVLSGFHVTQESTSVFDAFFSLAEQIGFKEKE